MPEACIHETRLGNVVLDGRKAAFLPRSRSLLLGDLHFEKASYLQMRGHSPLPAFDTDDTLERLKELIAVYSPDHLIVLGDSFHDEDAGDRLSASHFEDINNIVSSVPKFTWILGNHDPSIPKGLNGDQQDHLMVDGYFLTHLPVEGAEDEINICGHLHPKLKFKIERRVFTHPCFACAKNRLILPSFGTYTGGLYVDHPAISDELRGDKNFYITTNSEIYKIL